MFEILNDIIKPVRHFDNFSHYKGKIRYLMYKDLPDFTGGYNSVKTYKYKKYLFKIAQSSSDEDVIFSIYKSNICFILKIDLNNKTKAILEGFGNNPKCSTPELPKDGGGTIMMKFLLKFIKKHHPYITIIELCDNSMINCKDSKINLSSLYILTTGNTWYGKFGFTPQNKLNKQAYKKNVKIMKITKTKDILQKHKIKNMDKDNKTIKNSNNLLKDDLKSIFKTDCYKYFELEKQLFYLLNLTNMFGELFILDMTKCKI